MTLQLVKRLVISVTPTALHPALAVAGRVGRLLWRNLLRPWAVVRLVRSRGLRTTVSLLYDRIAGFSGKLGYDYWVEQYDSLSDDDVAAIRADIQALPERPLISVVMPVYNTPAAWLERAILSVCGQFYPNWELCIADDASTAPHVRPLLERAAGLDARIKVTFRRRNGHIAAASNDALALATGAFVALLDHDDELAPHALYMVAREIVDHPATDIVYSDEDKLDADGRRCEPYFKPDWDPDLFLGQNYLNHLTVYRRELLDKVGGFRGGFDGSQDYDLALRATECCAPERIRHIPHVLYHWRIGSGAVTFSSTQRDTAVDAARRAIAEALQRRSLPGKVTTAPGAETYNRVIWPVPDMAPLVSLLVPTRDRLSLIRQCVDGLLRRTDYPNLEVLILDNDSHEPDTLCYFDTVQEDPRVRVVPCPGPFNFSAINNRGVGVAKGEIIGLVNNDIDVIEPGWLREMVGHACRPEVGAVGAKLLYGDDSIQHAGVLLGFGGVAGHWYKFAPRHAPGVFGRLRLVQNLSACTAACLVLRRSVYEEVGGLDEANLAVAFNDVDFCLKIRERGYVIVWTPHAELYHLESVSRGDDNAPEHRDRFQAEVQFMRARWGALLDTDPYYNPNLTLDSQYPGLAFPPRVTRPWRNGEVLQR